MGDPTQSAASDLVSRRDAIVAEHGPWSANNVRLAEGVFTMGEAPPRPAEERVHRVVQTVADACGGLEGKRILDLGCYEGAFALELAAHGATVVGVDAREAHLVKARFAAEVLGITTTTFEVGDAREITVESHGTFDAVLCLGLLYHLEGAEAAALIAEIGRMTTRIAIVEGQISLTPKVPLQHSGHTYNGLLYSEDHRRPGASVVNDASFWFTRASLVNLLADSGFTSTMDMLTPAVPWVVDVRDHIAFAAFKGTPVPPRTLPPSASAYAAARWPEKRAKWAHPVQGLRYRIEERWRRRSGGGLPSAFRRV